MASPSHRFGSWQPVRCACGKLLGDGAVRGLPSGKEADSRVDAHGRSEASHLVRHVSRDTLPRVLPPPRLRTVRIPGHAPHAGILRTRCRTVPPRAVYASQTPFLGPAAERPLEDRLAAHKQDQVFAILHGELCEGGLSSALQSFEQQRRALPLLRLRRVAASTDAGVPLTLQVAAD